MTSIRTGTIERFATWVTDKVGTMQCAGLFACLALISFPEAVTSGSVLVMVGWGTQTFLQLVLLSILQLGTKRSGERIERVITETHDLAMAESRAQGELLTEVHTVHTELTALMREMHAAVTASGQPG